MGRIFSNELDNLVLDVYWITLREWPMKDFEAAVGHLMANAKYMPRPAEFTALRKASQPTPAEAWALVMERCKDWRKPIAAPDLIDQCVAGIGGYRSIAMADIERDLQHVQRRFAEAYQALDQAQSVRLALPGVAPAPSTARDGRFTAIGAPPIGRQDLVKR
jgi:hypothetical protein